MPLSGKVRELEDELSKRDEAIEILFSELYQIEKNFKDMETILRSILGQHGNLQEKLKETNVNQALKEVLSDMELQGGELGRLNI